MAYAPTEFEVTTSKGLGGDALTREFILDLWVKVTRNVTQHPLHHVTYSASKFDVPTSNGLGEGSFTKKIHCLTCDLKLGVKVTRNVTRYLYIM